MITLTTERLLLRAIESKDAIDLFELRRDPSIWVYTEGSPFETIEASAQFVHEAMDDMAMGKIMFWSIISKSDKGVVGTICLWDFDDERSCAEVGYELKSQYQGNRFASEALRAVLKYSQEHLSLSRLRAVTHEGHFASIQLLLNCGFEDLGFACDVVPDCDEGMHMKVYQKCL